MQKKELNVLFLRLSLIYKREHTGHAYVRPPQAAHRNIDRARASWVVHDVHVATRDATVRE